MEQYDFTQRHTRQKLLGFAEYIMGIQNKIGFKISSRGWCYQLEQAGFINKSQFNKVENLINKCRREGILPIDFVAEEEGRQFSEVHEPDTDTIQQHIRSCLKVAYNCENHYEPDWWKGEEYYIQMIVEKIDLKTLFRPVCHEYHIPIATSKGWSSMMQRAKYARRFKEAEEMGLKCVLLYCGDHDPDGLRISDHLMKNLWDLSVINWGDGEQGYNPSDLEIIRFGLDYKFIQRHNLTWIDNLITGSGKNLADPSHKNHNLSYLQQYLSRYGERKCEANAIVPMPEIARKLVEGAIIKVLGKDALDRFKKRKDDKVAEIKAYKDELGIDELIENVFEKLDDGEE